MSLERPGRSVHWHDTPAQFYPRRRMRPSPWSSPWDEALMDMDTKLSKFRFPQSSPPLVQPIESHFVEESGEDSPGKYLMNIPLGQHISPQDLHVTLTQREDGQKVLTVEARHEEQSKDGRSRVYSEFTKTLTLPPNIDVEHVKSVWKPEGDLSFLKVEAPLPPMIKHHEQEGEAQGEVKETEKEGGKKIAELMEIPIKRHHGLGHYLKKLVPKTSKT